MAFLDLRFVRMREVAPQHDWRHSPASCPQGTPPRQPSSRFNRSAAGTRRLLRPHPQGAANTILPNMRRCRHERSRMQAMRTMKPSFL